MHRHINHICPVWEIAEDIDAENDRLAYKDGMISLKEIGERTYARHRTALRSERDERTIQRRTYEPRPVPEPSLPLSERVYLVAAARRRGISPGLISAALGISRQRVDQLIQRYEANHGPVTDAPLRKIAGASASVRLKECEQCGEVFRIKIGQTRPNPTFCSNKCAGLARRVRTPPVKAGDAG